jgi:hypothetical protein
VAAAVAVKEQLLDLAVDQEAVLLLIIQVTQLEEQELQDKEIQAEVQMLWVSLLLAEAEVLVL